MNLHRAGGLRMRIETLIIHLKRAEQRCAHVKNVISGLPFEGRIVDAVDGQTITVDEIERHYRRKLHRPSYPFVMSRNEISCFLSHRKVWREILESNLDAALVMEDDAQPVSSFHDSLDLAVKHIEEAGFIRFPFRDGRERGEVINKDGTAQLIKPNCTGLGMVAQLIDRRTAEQLLRTTEQFDRPVDTLLQMHWVTGVHPHSIVPGGIMEISNTLGGTTLEKRKDRLMKLKREILRPIYRSRISLRARQ